MQYNTLRPATNIKITLHKYTCVWFNVSKNIEARRNAPEEKEMPYAAYPEVPICSWN